MKLRNTRLISAAAAFAVLAFTALSGCEGPKEQQDNRTIKGQETTPYAVKTVLHEEAAADPETGTGVYGRYTELLVPDDAPETLKNAVNASNSRAKEAVERRLSAVPGSLAAQTDNENAENGYHFAAYSYIVTLTRADMTAFSILETEIEREEPDEWGQQELSCRFRGTTCDTASGEEILLSDIIGTEADCAGMLSLALTDKYGVSGYAGTGPSDYAWTADALGIRFYFHLDKALAEKRRAGGDYSQNAATAALPYTALAGETAGELSTVPEAYMAKLERDTVYDLPHGNLSVMLTEEDDETVFCMIPDEGEETRLTIEHAGQDSDFYLLRSMGGFYLFRERIPYQEGFYYDFAYPDGGYGRFACQSAQCFNSFMNEIGLALPYNPYCAQMSEVSRSFGESSYDAASFIPYGNYSFPNVPDERYKCFVLLEDSLHIDSQNRACRLLEDMPLTLRNDAGEAAGTITVPAGETLILETVTGEAGRYLTPSQKRQQTMEYTVDARTTDGTKVRFVSGTESVLTADGKYLARFSRPVSLAEAQFASVPAAAEPFTVRIGGKDYPLISDYTKVNHVGEKIDFGDDSWWVAEGYAGRYEMTQEDRKEMEEDVYYPGSAGNGEKEVTLFIAKDGNVIFDYAGEIFSGSLPKERFYRQEVTMLLSSERESRTFQIILREGEVHDEPQKIVFYSEGFPATNEPSGVPPLSVFLTAAEKDRN